jgi:hypothetical protein
MSQTRIVPSLLADHSSGPTGSKAVMEPLWPKGRLYWSFPSKSKRQIEKSSLPVQTPVPLSEGVIAVTRAQCFTACLGNEQAWLGRAKRRRGEGRPMGRVEAAGRQLMIGVAWAMTTLESPEIMSMRPSRVPAQTTFLPPAFHNNNNDASHYTGPRESYLLHRSVAHGPMR